MFRRNCVEGAIIGTALGIVLVLWNSVAMAQTPAAPLNDPMMELVTRFLSTGGLPAAGFFLGYYIPHTMTKLVDGVVERFTTALHAWEPTVIIKYAEEENTQTILLQRRVEELETAVKNAGASSK